MVELLLEKYTDECLQNLIFGNSESIPLNDNILYCAYDSSDEEQLYDYLEYISTIEYMHEKFSNALVYDTITQEFSGYVE